MFEDGLRDPDREEHIEFVDRLGDALLGNGRRLGPKGLAMG
jgi:hypothetical protein